MRSKDTKNFFFTVKKCSFSNNATNTNRTDENLIDRINKFTNVIGKENVCSIPQRYIVDTVFVSHPVRFDIKMICTLKTNIAKLFQSNKQNDASIIYRKPTFIHREQLGLNNNFRQYLQISILPKKLCRMAIRKSPYKKPYELSTGVKSYKVNLTAINRQLDWLEISLP